MMSVQMPFGRGDGETLGRGALSSVSHLGLFSRWVLAKASGHQVAKWTGASRPLAVPPLHRTRRESRWASGAGRRREAASAATASASASRTSFLSLAISVSISPKLDSTSVGLVLAPDTHN